MKVNSKQLRELVDRHPSESQEMAQATVDDVVVHGLCACGHLDSEHLVHNGQCTAEDATCPCKQLRVGYWRATVERSL